MSALHDFGPDEYINNTLKGIQPYITRAQNYNGGEGLLSIIYNPRYPHSPYWAAITNNSEYRDTLYIEDASLEASGKTLLEALQNLENHIIDVFNDLDFTEEPDEDDT